MTAAGIVTTDSAVFAAMAAECPAEVAALSLACRALIYDVLPCTVEVVWPRQLTAGYGTGPKKRTDQFCWLGPCARHVVFGFCYGTELPDPARLLEGIGTPRRHVKIRSLDDLARPALRELLDVAVTHRVPPPAG